MSFPEKSGPNDVDRQEQIVNPMVVVLAFSATLLVAVLVSAFASRSILSTAVVFLIAGVLLGGGVFGVVGGAP